MSKSANDVVITGVGIVTSQGVGVEPHVAFLNAAEAPEPRVEAEKFKPYPVHPLPQIDWSQQIAKRGDQRQMENWQRLGVFAAGLALDDAGLKDNLDACGSMDMIVAAGGGERDINVDSLIVDEALKRNDREQLLNEKLTTELRPTLFLAQLSNLLAGNISIVHKVTGSSRTFMGEEAAGISAIETAFFRIKAGQSTHTLAGGAFSAERLDIMLMTEAIQAQTVGDWQPIWSRKRQDGGGMILGSVGAFLMLESREYAEARGARIYATIDAIGSDRGSRSDGKLEARLADLAKPAETLDPAQTVVFSGTSGLHDLVAHEKTFLEAKLAGAPVRAYGGLVGHSIEAQFPAGLALAALALGHGAKVPAFDASFEKPMTAGARTAVVTTIGHSRGEGVAVLSAE
ncbi:MULTISPECIES: beta-ketoacyl-ACP synthase [Ensifer]|jgi:3-oxoacyl-[acyl-carrier-protein] synthase II|uniref:Beta-ketoacyl-ACP synthase n=1 Tax=Ensifer canadensis TaxID=555315 RepID=A0AAW4FQ22_9HYPH|nr:MULTISPECIES: beta-ketoacyl-ACP synthase [Ensifer]MDP9630801.1 3-oxoacyl-[acyl-carrier-protein] synthase II [Ensifer adhaerens]KQU86160.1 3-oxoacyl-ACP synthase [Ensifer sp. Root31]KQW74461.1 3-oxoacyl-ACP synthase [Ensifer sp. Root127]KQY62130.1 3-oxoacyl-ACP synthase [Ensifer sp. Root142]MBD9487540.1 beta-ketoacyl-ACP synthase [Ensifer sp. ENS11]